ncbi:MAG: 4-alpha-glucanotransferase [Clostridia bacterium]|nr:4-alpha-glucanotransferase [Clostridia bacterium]
MKREAGILLPVSALPSRYGIGGFDRAAYEFVDFLREAGQSVWQILPLGPTGYGDSPYQSPSAFAGNPYFISLERLCEDGLLSEEECREADCTSDDGGVDYGDLYEKRNRLLRKAFSRSRQSAEQLRFEEAHRAWLEDYALFMARRIASDGVPSAEEMAYHRFLQFRFFEDLGALRRYANGKGIRIVGDLPIYVSLDSADVCFSPELFELNANGVPTAVAGCPPDGFAPKGQLWGNPLYDWQEHERTGYAWWIARLSHAFSMVDAVRIDHFRGFDSYYAIPYGAPDATQGEWRRGPGMSLFRAVREALGEREIIAEDLGFITDSVRALVRESGFAGMKILQFGFDGEEEHLPHRYGENSVAFTGTHDNPTLCEWIEAHSEGEIARIRESLWDFFTPRERLYEVLIASLMRSPSRLAIVPMQDYLGLGAEGRMNRPASLGNNWRWRMTRAQMSGELAEKIFRLTRIGGRLP